MRLLRGRAGEQGRGFAIVADEVRKLAEQSGESSGEIANLIAEIKADIEHTVKAMDNVSGEVQQGLRCNKNESKFYRNFKFYYSYCFSS